MGLKIQSRPQHPFSGKDLKSEDMCVFKLGIFYGSAIVCRYIGFHLLVFLFTFSNEFIFTGCC